MDAARRTAVALNTSTIRVTGDAFYFGLGVAPGNWVWELRECLHETHLTDRCGMGCTARCGGEWCHAALHVHCQRCGAIRCHAAWWRWRTAPRLITWEDQHSFPYLLSVENPITRRLHVHRP